MMGNFCQHFVVCAPHDKANVSKLDSDVEVLVSQGETWSLQQRSVTQSQLRNCRNYHSCARCPRLCKLVSTEKRGEWTSCRVWSTFGQHLVNICTCLSHVYFVCQGMGQVCAFWICKVLRFEWSEISGLTPGRDDILGFSWKIAMFRNACHIAIAALMLYIHAFHWNLFELSNRLALLGG